MRPRRSLVVALVCAGAFAGAIGDARAHAARAHRPAVQDPPGVRAEDPGRRTLEHFRAGRYGAAWTAAAAIEDPVERARRQLEAAFWAGSLDGAMEAAMEGLALAPTDPWLLFYGTDLALQLGALDRAATWSAGLSRAAEADPDLTPAQRDFYRERAAALAGELAERRAGRDDRRRRETRARATVALVAALGVGLGVFWARRPPAPERPASDGRAGA